MPAEAFRDLWDTLQAGRTWTGLVKNRSKNGDHYWVKATATPPPDGGFMSVRVKPTRDEVVGWAKRSVPNITTSEREMLGTLRFRASPDIAQPTSNRRLN